MDADVLRRGGGWSVDQSMRNRRVQSIGARPRLLTDEDLLPEPRQKRSIARHERLKTAALKLFGEKGYEGTSIDQIAHQANLPTGSFYQHYRSKRQLLLALMDELLEHLSRIELRPSSTGDIRSGLRDLLSGAFSTDLHYLGAYRAWREAALSDAELAKKQQDIHAWTTDRVMAVFNFLQQLPAARPGVDIKALAKVMDRFFWNLLGQALQLSKTELEDWINAATHLIFHALFLDAAEPVARSSR
jgi:AcrR family transcriptional regulator